MASDAPMQFVPVGENPARVFGMDARKRACRLASDAGFECSADAEVDRPALLASLAYGWDPAWLQVMQGRPRTFLTSGGKPVMAYVPQGENKEPVGLALEKGVPIEGYDQLAAENPGVNQSSHRRRRRPFVLPLDPDNPEPVERAVYEAAYNGVSDVLTHYLWRIPAFHLARWAARAGLPPNFITLTGALFCALVVFLFWNGQYWLGTLSALVFMVLDTVDGNLWRSLGASSRLNHILDLGIDFLHPPFWWWAWEHGLASYGRPLEPVYAVIILWTIIGGYVAQRMIEILSIKRFAGMEIHVWKPLDSKFRLIAAHRNPNMAILVTSLLFARPDIGLEVVAMWTLVSLIFHAVRLAQMTGRQERGQEIMSWLEA